MLIYSYKITTAPRGAPTRRMNIMTIVKNYTVRGRHFTIVKREEDGFYCAIEDKYITNGRLNRTLNGAQMHCADSLSRCLDNTQRSVDIDYYVEQGKSKAEAFAMVFDMDVKECEALFAR
jgi:hypothetical protein